MAGGFGWEVREGEAEMIGLMSPCDPKNLQHRGICSLIGYWKGGESANQYSDGPAANA